MDIKKQYRDEVNNLCESNLKLSAEDILAKADSRPAGVVTDLKGAHKSMNIRTRITAIAAACVVTTGLAGVVAGAAGFGPMADLFAKKAIIESSQQSIAQTDKVSSDLVKQGYVLEINETKSKDGFDVTFNGITGDITNPQLLFTVKVNDAQLVNNKTIPCTVYGGLSEDAYANRIDLYKENESTVGSYMYSNAVAFQDKEDNSIYYVSMLGNSAWMTEGSNVVVEFRSIGDGDNENMLNLVYKFKMPQSNVSLKDVKTYNWNMDEADSFKAPNKIDYYLTSVSFGEYETQVELYFDISHTKYAKNIKNFYESYDVNEKHLIGFVKDIKLVVDGKEYSPIKGSYGIFCDQKDGICNVAPYFPSINYEKAKNISLKYKDKEIIIKGDTVETSVDSSNETVEETLEMAIETTCETTEN